MEKIDFNLEQESTDEILCARCKRVFPATILTIMRIDGSYTPPICGICALEIKNQIHGLPANTPFQGEIAQDMVDHAEEYLFEQVKRRNLKNLRGDTEK